MNKIQILDPDQSYTFSNIFELQIEADDLVNEFGYSFQRLRLELPKYSGDVSRLHELQSRIEAVMPYVNLSNETSRREVLISQVLLEVVQQTKAQLRIEYPIKVNDKLQGYLDYLLMSDNELVVIEAKREDLAYGFTQLAVEMIALDQWNRIPNQPKLLGGVTTGNIWQFGVLDRNSKLIQQDLHLYRVPDDLDELMRILIEAVIE